MNVFTGTEITIILNTGVDLTGGTSPAIDYEKPSGAIGSWSAVISGNNVVYDTSEADLDEVGTWHFQAKITLNNKTVKGDIVHQPISKPIQ